jgi:hypothetical protein
MFLLFALGFFYLRRARGASCFADELAAGWDTEKIIVRYARFPFYQECKAYLPPSLPMLAKLMLSVATIKRKDSGADSAITGEYQHLARSSLRTINKAQCLKHEVL